jgi:hypothetical protein
MAQEYDNTNRGSIWKNEHKEKDTHADFTGSLNVNGVEFWVSAWKRKAGASEKAPALSFIVNPKEESGKKPSNQGASNNGSSDDFEDDVPFNRAER